MLTTTVRLLVISYSIILATFCHAFVPTSTVQPYILPLEVSSSFRVVEKEQRVSILHQRQNVSRLGALSRIGMAKRKKSGGGGGFGNTTTKRSEKKQKGSTKKKGGKSLIGALNEDNTQHPTNNGNADKTRARPEQDDLLSMLTSKSSQTLIGQTVASSHASKSNELDPFWELIPPLISSKFPHVRDDQLHRVAGMIHHTLNPHLPLEPEIIQNKWRPHTEIHAYMPNLGPTLPFHDVSTLPLCQTLSQNYPIILQEYEALLQHMSQPNEKDRFQSVTTMNYESGWKTMVLFYNGHRLDDFPYHLCPVTTRIMESVPLAGRIAGFNRQKAGTGIPLHSDGNNMWLTCQMGIKVPSGDKAYIRVGPETRHWLEGQCLLYDTTYEHETMNDHETEERVVLHIDFFNTLSMTPVEIDVMKYIYLMREEFMKAEGVSKVGEQIL